MKTSAAVIIRVLLVVWPLLSPAVVWAHGCDSNPCAHGGRCENFEDQHYCCHCTAGYGGQDCRERQKYAQQCVYCSANQIPTPEGTRSHTVCDCVDGERRVSCADGQCFHQEGKVQLPSGEVKAVGDLVVGDRVRSADDGGNLLYSRVVAILHRTPVERHTGFIRVRTESGHAISLTPGHLVHTCAHSEQSGQSDQSDHSDQSDQPNQAPGPAVFAHTIQTGDYLCVQEDGGTSHSVNGSKVVGIEQHIGGGAVSPLTAHGNIVVDGVLASCYGHVNSELTAHWAFSTLRLLSTLRPLSEGGNNGTEQLHWYAVILRSVANVIMPETLVGTG